MTEAVSPPVLERSHLEFAVVGIGASAGGMKALADFFAHMPDDPGMAFVVVLHLSAEHQSHAPEILQRSTKLTVLQVVDSAPIEINHVYVIPPGKQLTMNDGHLVLKARDRRRTPPVDIDLFFRTLAEVHTTRAFGIVLSGAGSDGVIGLKSLKEHGGILFAQNPLDAEHDSMPTSAIATGVVDFVLPAAEMPARLVMLWANARQIRLPGGPADPDRGHRSVVADSDEAVLNEVLALLRRRTRHDFREYKRGTTLRRIERRLQVNALPNLISYRDYLRDHEEEAPLLLQDLLISVTQFFRDGEAFEALESIVAAMIERSAPDEPVRVWVAGCATGEEAYSIAIVLREQCDRMSRRNPIQVFATDIDERAIAVARAGVYPGALAADVSAVRLRRFFRREDDQYQIVKPIRDTVLFAMHNLLSDPPFSRLDLVCCRNVLIYLNRGAQATVLETFRYALRGNGLLFLGQSESAEGLDDAFVPVDKKRRIFQIGDTGRRPHHIGPLPSPPEVQFRRGVAATERRTPSLADVHLHAIERYSNPSMLLDTGDRILHLSAGAGRFLVRGDGKPSNDLIANAHPDLRLELRAALFRSTQTGEAVLVRDVRMRSVDGVTAVDLSVQPFSDEQNGPYVLVRFNEHPDLPPRATTTDDSSAGVIHRLEHEIEALKAHLQETIDRSNIGTEELRASNEELQAMVEELRSTGEELETSKEELQSINEELSTVNDELSLKVEEKAKISDDLQNLIASTEIAVIFVDAAMRVMRFTPRATELFNLIPTDVGRPLSDIRHHFETDEAVADAEEAFRSLRPIEREIRGLDGRYYLSRVLPYRTVEDRIEGAVLTFVDVSERRLAEEEARRSAERLRRATESTRDYAIVTLDEKGVVETWNVGAVTTFGYEEAEAVGQFFGFIFTEEDREADVPRLELERARQQGRAEDERWHLKKGGVRFYCSGATTRIDGDSGGFAKIARDMTGSKLLETRRDALLSRETENRVEAEAANRLKDEFLAVMSHELKHPLNLVHINAELLTRTPAIQELPLARRAADTIRKTVAGQAKIIDDLLDLSRARTGKMTLTIERVVLAEVARRIVDASMVDIEAKKGTIELVESEPDLAVRADPVRVEQIVWNLVHNAVKFTAAGGKVRVAIARDGECGRLDVADSGRGITADFLPNVFEMFQQETRTFGADQGGMGIGLALVKELMVAQRGRVAVHSDGIDRGSTFSIWLPLDAPGSANADAGTLPDANPLEGVRILLVDDSEEVLETMAELMRLDGGIVTACASGPEALARLDEASFDVLISDIGMPGMDGYQLIDEVRKRPGGRTLPAIALTGFGRASDERRAIEVGFDAHLGKPTSTTDLAEAVVALLRR